jgi:hypothetical protein
MSWFILFEGDKYARLSFDQMANTNDFYEKVDLNDKNFAIVLKKRDYTAILVVLQTPKQTKEWETMRKFQKFVFSETGSSLSTYLPIEHFRMYSTKLKKDTKKRLHLFFSNLESLVSGIDFDSDTYIIIKKALDIIHYNKSQSPTQINEYCQDYLEVFQKQRETQINMENQHQQDYNDITYECTEYARLFTKYNLNPNVHEFKQMLCQKYQFGANFVNENNELFKKFRRTVDLKTKNYNVNQSHIISPERPTIINGKIEMVQYESNLFIEGGRKALLYTSPFVVPNTIEHIFMDASWIDKNMIISVSGVNKKEKTYQTILFVLVPPTEMEQDVFKKASANSRIYSVVIAHLKRTYPITSITCDFETALIKAARENNLKMWGCYFHYLQNLRIHTFKESASFQAFQILRLMPLLYLRNQNSLIMKAKQALSNGVLADIALLKYAENTYFENKDVIFSLKLANNKDYFKLTNNACERLFNVLKRKWRSIKKITGVTSFQKIRHILIENLAIDKQTKLGGKKNKKGLIEREVSRLTDSMNARIVNYQKACTKDMFTNLQKQKIEKKDDSSNDDDDLRNDDDDLDDENDDQEEMTNIDGKRMRSTTLNLINKSKFSNPKKALTVTSFKEHLLNKKFKETVAIVTEKGILLKAIEGVKQELAMDFQKRLEEQAQIEKEARERQALIHEEQLRFEKEAREKLEEQAKIEKEARLVLEEQVKFLMAKFANEDLKIAGPCINPTNPDPHQINDTDMELEENFQTEQIDNFLESRANKHLENENNKQQMGNLLSFKFSNKPTDATGTEISSQKEENNSKTTTSKRIAPLNRYQKRQKQTEEATKKNPNHK